MRCERIDAFPAWHGDSEGGAGALPVNVLQQITQWMSP
jgi:hypothetical protein